jgi:hypothetical protein
LVKNKRKSIRELRKHIATCRREKKKIDYVIKSGAMHINGRTPEQLHTYYDQCIAYYKQNLAYYRKAILKKWIPAVTTILLAMLVVGGTAWFSFGITGATINNSILEIIRNQKALSFLIKKITALPMEIIVGFVLIIAALIINKRYFHIYYLKHKAKKSEMKKSAIKQYQSKRRRKSIKRWWLERHALRAMIKKRKEKLQKLKTKAKEEQQKKQSTRMKRWWRKRKILQQLMKMRRKKRDEIRPAVKQLQKKQEKLEKQVKQSFKRAKERKEGRSRMYHLLASTLKWAAPHLPITHDKKKLQQMRRQLKKKLKDLEQRERYIKNEEREFQKYARQLNSKARSINSDLQELEKKESIVQQRRDDAWEKLQILQKYAAKRRNSSLSPAQIKKIDQLLSIKKELINAQEEKISTKNQEAEEIAQQLMIEVEHLKTQAQDIAKKEQLTEKEKTEAEEEQHKSMAQITALKKAYKAALDTIEKETKEGEEMMKQILSTALQRMSRTSKGNVDEIDEIVVNQLRRIRKKSKRHK